MSIEEARAFWGNVPEEWAHIAGPMPRASFDALGAGTRERVVDVMKRAGRSLPVTTIVEWGAGGGANAAALAGDCDRYIAIDVCESRRAILAETAPAAEVVIVDMAKPDQAETATGSADLFLSTWCFNHFDSTDYGRRVLRVASRLLAPDGVALIHAPVTDGEKPDASLPYADRWCRATAWSTREWLDDIKAVGFLPMRIQRDDSGLAWCSARKG